MSYLSGIKSIKQLGALPASIIKQIEGNKNLVTEVLQKREYFSGLGAASDVMPFAEVLKMYNQGISDAEIKAWVWFKRKQGVPMTGWEYYYISDSEIPELVKAGALFISGNTFLPLAIYTFGNMYDRMQDLQENKKAIIKNYGQEIYNNHEKAISEALPSALTVKNPEPKERPIIKAISKIATDIDTFYIKELRAEYSDTETAEELKIVNGVVKVKARRERTPIKFDGDTKYSLSDVFRKWLHTLTQVDFKNSNATFIAEYYILNKPLRDDKMKEAEKKELKTNARNEGEALFAKFLHECLKPEDQERLDKVFNLMYNSQADINHKRVPVGFETSLKFKSGKLELTPIQREGVAYLDAMGSGVLAFDVGVGKTMCAIAALANSLYAGKCKRPLIAVPNPTYKNWIGEIIGYDDKHSGEFVPGVLSHTGVTINDWYNLGTGIKDKIDFSKPVKENSITIVSYEGLVKIGFSEKLSGEFLDTLVNVLEQKEKLNEGATAGLGRQKSARAKEVDYQKYKEMIGAGNKDTVCDIDTVGFDFIVIDEAHNFKNIFSNVDANEQGDKRYSMTAAVSTRGVKAFFLCNYIQKTYGRNVVLLTATPFSNSPLEIYSILSLVAYESFVENNITNINTFFDLFVQPTTEPTANYKDEIVEKEVIKSFTNRLMLQKFIYNHILYRTGEEAGVKRPCKINIPLLYAKTDDGRSYHLSSDKQILTYLEMTDKQRANQTEIVELAQQSTSGHGKPDIGNLMRALAQSINNAISPYLYNKNESPSDYKAYVNESPKIQYVCECIRSVKEWHEQNGQECSGQVIYMNRGKDYFPLIKQYLENEVGFKKDITSRGVRFDEVEMLTGDTNEKSRENIKTAFLDGAIKVLIGTSTIREGINLQKRGTVVYNCYPDWNPTDVRQLEGRIWRQGNMFAFVRSVMPLVQNSMDVFVFQKLEEKTARINDIWYKADRGNVLDVESLDPEEVKIALITDIGRLTMLFIKAEIKDLEIETSKNNSAISQLENINSEIERYTDSRNDAVQFITDVYNSLPTEKEFIEKLEKPEQKRLKELCADIEKFQTSSQQTDDDIVSLVRRCRNIYSITAAWVSYYSAERFKDRMTNVRRTERTILKPKGYSLTDDLTKLMEEYIEEKKVIEGKAKQYQNEKDRNTVVDSPRYKELYAEVERKKAKLAVDGGNIPERVHDFAKINYILQYLKDDVETGVCFLPEPDGIKKKIQVPALPAKEESELEAEMQIEFEMLALELELLNLKAVAGI